MLTNHIELLTSRYLVTIYNTAMDDDEVLNHFQVAIDTG